MPNDNSPPRPRLSLVASAPRPVSNLRLVVVPLRPLREIPVLGRIS